MVFFFVCVFIDRPFFTGRGGAGAGLDVHRTFRSYPVSLFRTLFLDLLQSLFLLCA